MPSFRINVPLTVTLDVEVNTEIFDERVAQLLANTWAGGSLHPSADNFLMATRRLVREAAAWALAADVDELDYSAAKKAIPEETIRVTPHGE